MVENGWKRHPGERKGYPEPAEDLRNRYLNEDGTIVHAYYLWLLEQVGTDEESSQHGAIFRRMFQTEFYEFVPNDDNRAADGQALRVDFAREHGVNRFEELDGPCRFLEMLVALAIRMDMQTADAERDIDRRGYWFWILLDHMGLRGMTNVRYMKEFGQQVCDEAMHIVMDRLYEPNGEGGGLFPLKFAGDRDLRKIELWYQMQYYLTENWSYRDYRILE